MPGHVRHRWNHFTIKSTWSTKTSSVAKALADREGQMKDLFYVISVLFVVFKFHKSFAFKRLRWNVAGYKNNCK